MEEPVKNPDESLDSVYQNYALYSTRESRSAASAALSQDPEKVAKLLNETLGRTKSLAPTDVATLLQFANDAVVVKPLEPLVAAQSELLALVFGSSRDRLAGACVAQTRKSVGDAARKFGPEVYLKRLEFPTAADLALTSLLAQISTSSAVTFASAVESASEKWAQGFGKVVLAAKVMPSTRFMACFSGYLAVLPQSVWDETLVPAIARALLRAAEAVLVIFPQIVAAVSPSLQFDAASKAWQSSLISSIGSSNAAIRQLATRALSICLDKSQALADPVIAAFSKSTGEARALYAQILLHIDSCNENAVKALDTIAAKETSEATVHILARAVCHFNADAVLKRGAEDKRQGLRREWVVEASRTLARGGEETSSAFQSASTAAATAALDSVLANPIAAIASKFIAAGYAAAAALKAELALPLLQDPKIYERLSTTQDYSAALSALRVLIRPSITDAVVYICRNAPLELREKRDTVLHEIYKAPGVPLALAASCESLDCSDLRIVSVFSTPHAESELALARGLIIIHKAAPKNGWTGVCLKANVDPGKIVGRHYEEMLKAIWEAPEQLRAAADSALATIAFVKPELIAPLVASFIQTQLKPQPLDEDQVLIYETPEGQLAMTTEVKKKNAAATDSKRKGDLAWDEQIRQELAKKNSKLSPEDKKLIEEQQRVRESVAALIARYTRAITAINALSKSGLDNGINVWFPVAVGALLEVSKIRVVNAARDCLLGLTRNISPRFESVLPLVGKSLLWRLRLSELGSAETLNEVLYRAKFLADQKPLDEVLLIYLLPILISIIKEAARPKKSDALDEQLLLVLNIIATEADELNAIGRQDLIVSLIDLLEKNLERAKEVKDCLQRVAQGVIFDSEEQAALLRSTVSTNSYVRVASLEIIDAEVDLRHVGFSPEVFIERFGEEAELASTIWEESGMSVGAAHDNAPSITESPAISLLLPFIGFSVRTAVARAIEYIVVNDQKLLQPVIRRLVDLYCELREPPKEILDEFGGKSRIKPKDPWESRSGILKALTLLVPIYDRDQTIQVSKFVAEEAVSDPAADCITHSHDLGLHIVEVQGAQYLDDLLPLFSSFIEQETKNEQVRQAHVLLYGMEARHLASSDPRLADIVEKLIEALKSSSEKVQFSVSKCLAPLAKRIDPHSYFETLLDRVFNGESSELRKGAAYGISGLTKGIGISALSDYGVVRAINEGAEDKKNTSKREGAQFAIDCLSLTLGKLFEPYALELLPVVLGGLGDNQIAVRIAATGAGRTIMKHTTGYGIKTQIPCTLRYMDDTAWRAKKGAVELLGTMAYLDPQQLSASLSTIIPEIVNVLGDTHKEVCAAARGSLKSFGEVIKNPEIKELVPKLLDAISDPTKNTEAALDALLKTKFVHYIDSPSLAIVIHVLKRGMRDRSANTKRRACQVVGNMSILTEPEDLVPYLPEIMPDLQVAMVDPVPATCATACKALGVLVEKLGEDTFPQVIPGMLETLKDASKISDRWGVAQGLSEVIHGLGIAKLEEMLPVILKNCGSPKPWIRQSYIPLLMFLPASFGQAITPYLPQITPAVLQGLADSLDDVRENALKAGRRLVRNFAAKAVDLMLPELELGMSDPNYRIRLSSVELTGDLLFQLSGVSKNTSDDAVVSSRVQSTLMDILGSARRDRILSLIFICRADIVAAVRNSALEVWMTLVANTPRTVKEILPTLTQFIVKKLSDDDDELQKIAARALGELVRRVNGALVQLLPTFKQLATDPDSREGICIGLIELIESTPMDALKANETELTSLIRGCLTDLNNSVREAASRAFDALQEALGEVASDILPELISQMEQGDDGAFAALKEMMSTSPEVVFPALLPKLIAAPITATKASSLADICDVAGEVLYKRIETIVDALLGALVADDNDQVSESLTRILLNYTPQAHLLSVLKNSESARRRLVLSQLAAVFAEDHDQIDMLFAADFVSLAIMALEDSDPSNVEAAFSFLSAITSALPKAQLAELVVPSHKALAMTSAPLAGFQLPKGVSCVLPIFLQGITLGSNREREVSALAIADIVERTEPDNLKSVVTAMTGPLIRVVGEKYPAEVKSAILYTLNVLLQKIPQFLRPFLPQLQRTFAKCLADPASAVLRNRAAKALGTLIALQPRLEPLVKEVVGGIETSTDAGVTASMLRALYEITSRQGASLAEPTQRGIIELVLKTADRESDERQLAVLAKIGAIMLGLRSDGRAEIRAFQGSSLFSLLAMNAVLVHAPQLAREIAPELVEFLVQSTKSHNGPVSEGGVAGLGKYVLGEFPESAEAVSTLVESIEKDENRSPAARRLALISLRALARTSHRSLEPHLDALLKPLFACVRDTTIPVKLAAENTFLDVFRFLDTGDSTYFEQYFEGAVQRGVVEGPQQRSIQEYVRRVAMRHVVSRKEQLESGVEDDMAEDLSEVMAVGASEARERD